jgi:NADH dehydrogenase FAD-containing subunit
MQIFGSIPEGLKQYGESVQFILGLATALDVKAKTVTVKTEKGEEKLHYEQLVIATGSRTVGDAPWKGSLNGHQATLKLLHETQEAVKNAKSIIVGGGGKFYFEIFSSISPIKLAILS